MIRHNSIVASCVVVLSTSLSVTVHGKKFSVYSGVFIIFFQSDEEFQNTKIELHGHKSPGPIRAIDLQDW